MMLAQGMMAALWEAQRSGQGQVVDAAMVDGAAYLMAMLYGVKAAGCGASSVAPTCSTAAPSSTAPTRSDGKFVAVGPIEPQFYAEFLARLGSEDPDLASHYDPPPGRSSGRSWRPSF